MTIHKLKMTGHLDGDSVVTPSGAKTFKRRVLLCYVGEFESMDGPVVVTEEKLEKIAKNYNAQLAKAKELSDDGSIPDKFAAPLQLDHSDSAKETVGRNYDELSLAPYKKLDGNSVTGLYSYTTFIGEENVKNGSNGIWAHVSIGADFENGIFQELTITPFPAAPEASLLSKKGNKKIISTINNGEGIMGKKEQCLKYMMDHKEMSKEKAEAEYTKMSDEQIESMCGKMKKLSEGKSEDDKKKEMAAGDVSKMSEEEKDNIKKMAAAIEEDDKKKMSAKKEEDEKKLSEEEKKAEEKKLAAGDVTKMSEEDKGMLKKMSAFLKKMMGEDDSEKKKLSADEDEEKKKLAAGDVTKMSEKKDAYMKKLMEEKEMSKEEAKEKMSKMSDEEISKAIDKHEKEQHGDDKDGKKKLSAPKTNVVRLSKEKSSKIIKLRKGFESTLTSTRLSVKKAKVVHRLSSLRSQAKITPAEIKKIDIDELAGKSDDVINEVMKTYADRQPVINSMVLGTQKGMDLSQLSKEVESSRLVKVEEEHVANMPHLKRMKANAEAAEGKGKTDGETPKVTKLSAVAHMDRMAHADGDIPLGLINDKEIDEVQNNFENLITEGKLEEAKRLMSKTFSDVKRLRSTHGAGFADQDGRIDTIEESIENLSNAFNSMIEIVEPLLEK